jgi:hypothetical protein
MPEQQQAAPDWSQEGVEKQAAELEQKQVEQPDKIEKPAPEKTEGEDGEVKDKVEKVVPVGAMHEERAKRREATQRAQAAEQQAEQYKRQMLELMARMQQPAQPQIDPNDTLAVTQHTVQQTAAEVKALREASERQAQETQQQENVRRFVADVQAKEQEFLKEQPDGVEGVKFLKESRLNEYKAGGLSHAEASQRMLHDERELVIWAMRNGENPAKVAFDIAVARGYVSPAKKLEMQKNGQGASMPSGGSGKAGGAPSLEALLKMDSAEFAKATAGDKWEKLLKHHS